MGSPDTGRPKRSRQATLDELRTKIDACMRSRGLHFTEPRRLIIEEFLSSREHFTLDDMAARVRERSSSIGFSTVYRTLRLLVECGVAEEHHFGDKMTRYEIAEVDAHHDHLVCTTCGKIFEFCEPRIESLQDEVATRFGFHQRTHKLEIYGECSDCGAAASRKRRPVTDGATAARLPSPSKSRRK